MSDTSTAREREALHDNPPASDTSQPAPKRQTSPWHFAALAAALLLVAWFRFSELDKVPSGIFNDQAVELLQSEDIPTDRFHFYAPSYRGGNVDIVESLVPYIVHSFRRPGDVDFQEVHILFGGLFVAAALLVSLTVAEAHGLGWGALAAALFGVSAYASYMSRILTRNGISVFWSALIIYLMSRVLADPPRRSRWAAAAIPVVLTASLLSYTSFKAMFLAVHAVWILYALRKRWWPGLAQAAASLALTAGAIVALAHFGQTSLEIVLRRGNYVLPAEMTVRTLATYAAQSLALPVHLAEHFVNGGFFVETVHSIFGRAMLAPALRPFFVVGLLVLLWRFVRGRDGGYLALTWLAVSLPLSVGGPSLKTHFVVWPLVVLIGVEGLRAVSGLIPAVPDKIRVAVAVALIAGVVATERPYLFRTVPERGLFEARPPAIAREALRLAPDFDRIFITGMGKDVMTLFTRHEARVQFLFPDQIDSTIAAQTAAGQPFAFVTDGGPPMILNEPRFQNCVETRELRRETEIVGTAFYVVPPCAAGN